MFRKTVFLYIFFINVMSCIHGMPESHAAHKDHKLEEVRNITCFHARLEEALRHNLVILVKKAFADLKKVSIDPKKALNILINGQHTFMQLAIIHGCDLSILQELHNHGEKIFGIEDQKSTLRFTIEQRITIIDPNYSEPYFIPVYVPKRLFDIIDWLIKNDPYIPKKNHNQLDQIDPVVHDFIKKTWTFIEENYHAVIWQLTFVPGAIAYYFALRAQ